MGHTLAELAPDEVRKANERAERLFCLKEQLLLLPVNGLTIGNLVRILRAMDLHQLPHQSPTDNEIAFLEKLLQKRRPPLI